MWGLPEPLTGEIEGAIGRDKRDRKRMAVVDHGGKFALTRYRTMRAWQTSLALLECRLATGRTHQIRVHFAAKGHPIVGDPLYLRRVPAVAKAVDQPLRGQLLDFPRQALHAASLGFKHPRTGRLLTLRSADCRPICRPSFRTSRAFCPTANYTLILTGLILVLYSSGIEAGGCPSPMGTSGYAAASVGG